MKLILQKTALATGLAFALGSASASPFTSVIGNNITISDKNSAGSGWYSDREDQETEINPSTVTSQQWDLEGMFLKGNKLTLVGGFDFKNGVNWSDGHNYKSGDIFIDVTGDAQYGQVANGNSGATGYGSGPHTAVTNNAFGYDYALHLDYSTMTYDVYKLTPQSEVVRVVDVASSNPWQYYSGGTALAGYQNVAFNYISGLTNADTGFGGDSTNSTGWSTGSDKHYAIQTDLSFLPHATTAIIHYTMECGNDNLMGSAKTVPDAGSSALLLGGAVVGLMGFRRKFFV